MVVASFLFHPLLLITPHSVLQVIPNHHCSRIWCKLNKKKSFISIVFLLQIQANGRKFWRNWCHLLRKSITVVFVMVTANCKEVANFRLCCCRRQLPGLKVFGCYTQATLIPPWQIRKHLHNQGDSKSTLIQAEFLNDDFYSVLSLAQDFFDQCRPIISADRISALWENDSNRGCVSKKWGSGPTEQTKNLMMRMQQIGNNIQRKYNDAHATNMK